MHWVFWVWLAFVALIYPLSTIVSLRRLYQEEYMVKEMVHMLGVSEKKLEDLRIREKEQKGLNRRPGVFSGQNRRQEYARRVERQKEISASDEERMKTIVEEALLGKRAEDLRRKGNKQEIMDGLKQKADNLKDEVRLLEVLIEGFLAWECAMEDVPAAEV